MNKNWICQRPIAHRGLHNLSYPENSLSSFKNGIEKNFIIELDLLITKDNKIVVFHDFDLDRMLKQKGFIEDFKYEDLKKLNFYNYKEGIPTLEEVLKLVNGQVGIFLDIKPNKDIRLLAFLVKDLLRKYKGNVAITSISDEVLNEFKSINEKVMLGKELTVIKSGFLSKLIIRFRKIPNLLRENEDKYDFYTYDVKLSFLKKKMENQITIGYIIKNQKEFKKYKRENCNVIFEGFIPKNN